VDEFVIVDGEREVMVRRDCRENQKNIPKIMVITYLKLELQIGSF
jgi:hypothetical protein